MVFSELFCIFETYEEGFLGFEEFGNLFSSVIGARELNNFNCMHFFNVAVLPIFLSFKGGSSEYISVQSVVLDSKISSKLLSVNGSFATTDWSIGI